MDEENIIERVCLLAMLKKEQTENIKDVQLMLVETGMFEMKECKQVFKSLKEDNYISSNNQLTLKGITEAKKAEEMFKQH